MAFWRAIYKDKTFIDQSYFEPGVQIKLENREIEGSELKERLFKDIDQSKLLEFAVIFDETHQYSVFVDEGVFGINGQIVRCDVDPDKERQLIYFVRRQKILGVGNPEIVYHIGFQEKGGKKFILAIPKNTMVPIIKNG